MDNQTVCKLKFDLFIPLEKQEEKKLQIEVMSDISFSKLKKIIKKQLSLGDEYTLKISYQGKLIKSSLKEKLSDIFPLDQSKGKNIKLNVNYIKRSLSFNNKIKGMKYMYECPIHIKENGYYYCINCKISFCSFCISNHNTHSFIDKYEYSQTHEKFQIISKEIFSDLFLKIQENSKTYSLEILPKTFQTLESNGDMINDEINRAWNFLYQDKKPNTTTEIQNKVKDLIGSFNELYQNNATIFKEKTKKKIEDFKLNLIKFRLICKKYLDDHRTKFSSLFVDDFPSSSEEALVDYHKILNELNLGKDALTKYCDSLNRDITQSLEEVKSFDLEILSDLQKIISKIKNKLNQDDISNIRKCDENLVELEDLTIKESHSSLFRGFEMHEINQFNSPIKSPIILNNLGPHQKDISEFKSSNEVKFSSLVMKRSLGGTKKSPRITIYEVNKDTFKKVKIDKKNSFENFLNFLPFSVYLNVNDLLYISGGRYQESQILTTLESLNETNIETNIGDSKLEKYSRDFLCYDPLKNMLIQLNDMHYARCSHSMVFFPPLNQIIAVGGCSNNTCEKYDISKKLWYKLPSLISNEKQVPTLLIFDERFLFTFFGFTNNSAKTTDLFCEKLDLYKDEKWQLIKIVNGTLLDCNLFNVGAVMMSKNEFLLCGGEYYNKGEENDKVLLLDIKNNIDNNFCISLNLYSNSLPSKSSFIDKNFIQTNQIEFCQFDMKKNNLLVFDVCSKEFKLKLFN